MADKSVLPLQVQLIGLLRMYSKELEQKLQYQNLQVSY